MRKAFMLCAALMFVVGADAQRNNYTVSSIITSAQDSRLVNPWGLSRPTRAHLENEWWVDDQVTGLSTLYDVNGTLVDLAVTVPPASGNGPGSPTGTAFDNTSLSFAFATLDGTISIWNALTAPTTASLSGKYCTQCHVSAATIMVNHSGAGASYQGLTIAQNATTAALAYYVANANGGVEAYDATSFSPISLPAGAFTDTRIPMTYAPAGIQAIGSEIFVAYNATAGGGTGYVDGFDTNGKLLVRLQDGSFNQPWGVVEAPPNFGSFSGSILVGNTGSGLIGAYRASDGAFRGFLQSQGTDVAIPGLWGLEFGDGASESGPINVLYFNAGGLNQTIGVFGAITPN